MGVDPAAKLALQAPPLCLTAGALRSVPGVSIIYAAGSWPSCIPLRMPPGIPLPPRDLLSQNEPEPALLIWGLMGITLFGCPVLLGAPLSIAQVEQGHLRANAP